MTPQIFDVLDRAGHKYKRSGQWIRLKNKEFDAVSVNADSGAYRDHRTGEHGNFHALCEKLGIDSGGIYIDTRRIINSNREKTEEKQDRQRIQHAKTIYNRALPSVALNRKNGYAQAAWDRIQAEYADHREAVYDYLLSRGLDPLPLMRYIRIIPMLSDKGMDAEMQEKGADFCFIVPMYEIGKPQIPEHICGIQRTYLAFSADKYGKVRKIGRAMLGKKGVTELQLSSPNPVTLPTENGALGGG